MVGVARRTVTRTGQYMDTKVGHSVEVTRKDSSKTPYIDSYALTSLKMKPLTRPSNPRSISISGKTFAVFLALSVKVLGCLILHNFMQSYDHNLEEYSYLENDYPREWEINTGDSVKMPFEDSVWFSFEEGPLGAALWSSQVPQNGTIYLGQQKRPFSIAMFHEIRCVSHLREETLLGRKMRESNKPYTPNRLSSHCLNYLRQMALCRADIDLEPVSILPPTVHEYEYRCNDWTTVYKTVEQNQELARKGSFPA